MKYRIIGKWIDTRTGQANKLIGFLVEDEMCNTQLLGLTDVLALSKNIDNFSYTREKYKILGVADDLIPLYSSDGAMQGNLMTILGVSKSGVYYKVLSATGNTHECLAAQVIEFCRQGKIFNAKLVNNHIVSKYGSFFEYPYQPLSKRTEVEFVISDGTVLWGTKGSVPPVLKIPEGVVIIAPSAFACCKELKKVIMPNSVKFIDDEAFDDCCNLTEVVFSNTLYKIGELSFEYCTALKSIVLPKTCNYIGAGAFVECTNLESVRFNGCVNTLGREAFYRCIKLNSVNIENVDREGMGQNVFRFTPLQGQFD